MQGNSTQALLMPSVFGNAYRYGKLFSLIKNVESGTGTLLLITLGGMCAD
jgi:hypothetical protein